MATGYIAEKIDFYDTQIQSENISNGIKRTQVSIERQYKIWFSYFNIQGVQ